MSLFSKLVVELCRQNKNGKEKERVREEGRRGGRESETETQILR